MLFGSSAMITGNEAYHEPPSGSVVTWFVHREAGDPKGIVIGPEHAPYYVFDDGRTEVVSNWDESPPD